MEINNTFWIPDITDWWRQQKETPSKHIDTSILALDTFSIIPHGVGVDACFFLGQDIIGWRQSKSTGKTLGEKVVVSQFTWANNGLFAGADPELDTTNTENDTEMKKETEERKLHRMAKVHNFLDMRQGSQNLCPTQMESCTQNKQMPAIRYILDTEEIVNVSWSLFQHDDAAAFKLLEKSHLPPALSAKDLSQGRTTILNVSLISRINRYPVESDQEKTPESLRTRMIGSTGKGTSLSKWQWRPMRGRRLLSYGATQWHWGSVISIPAEYVCCVKCSQIDSAYTKVKVTRSKGVGDGQCNQNKDE